MKAFLSTLITIFFFTAQLASGQVQDHPTVEKIKVMYKATNEATTITSGKPNIKVKANATVTLKTTTSVTKLYFKILNKTSGTVVYQVDYNLNASPVTDSLGQKLFGRDGLVVCIGDPSSILLDTYSYELITEDAQGNQTAAFTTIQ